MRDQWSMSNSLKVSLQTTIYSLDNRGWSRRRIARELGIDRETVGRYLRLAKPAILTTGLEEAGDAKPAIPTAGLEEACEAKPAISTTGLEEASEVKPAIPTPGFAGAGEAKSAISTAGLEEASSEVKPAISTVGNGVGRKSQCEPLAAVIMPKVELGLSAQRIYQDLVNENGFTDSYQSVKRFVRKLREAQPERVWRLECQPGEELQLDFGLGAPIDEGQGKRRRSWVLRMVLSYSRKGYSEAVTRQDTETFLRCLENGLRNLGGSTLLLNLDNMKTAVLKADWFDPEINPKLADFCRHYSIHVVPCRPGTPQHKGKIERGVAYLRTNALKGRRFRSLAEENRFLSHWEGSVADKRIHGTTRKQVAACFEEERPHLQPLPASLFPCFQEGRRSVHRDSYVEVEKAFYEAPPELIGREVWVRWDSRCVKIFNERMEQVGMHTRQEPGKFSHSLGAGGFSAPVLSSCRYWVNRAAVLGEQCGQWAQSALDARGPESLRSIMGLCNLIKKHSGAVLNAACAKALKAGTHRLKDVRRLIGEQSEQSAFSFAQSHPLIRDLKTYSEFVHHHSPYQNND
jgi:transposase